MKKIVYFFLTILAAVLVFSAIMFLFIQNKGRGALQITANPNAKVYLDDKLIGTTPLCKCDSKDMVLEGEHKLRLVSTSGSFDPFEQTITVNPSVLTVVDKTFQDKGLDSASIISLSQISDKKDLRISAISIPTGAKIFLDDQFKGQSPLLIENVKESDHDLKITKDGFKDKTVRIRTIPGFKLEVLVYLGLDPNLATASSQLPLLSPKSQVKKIIILETPTGFLRVRDEASLLGSEIAQVKPNETYELLNREDGWYQIKLTNGKTGWISSQYAQETK
jgi:hypothetical protein